MAPSSFSRPARVGGGGRRLELVQKADLVRAASVVHRVTQLSAIEAYFARHMQDRIVFEQVEV